MKFFNYKIFTVIALICISCNTVDVYEKTKPISRHEWRSDDRLSFTFTSVDSLAYYNIYFVVRHTESYHFNNIWIDFALVEPNKKSQTQRLNLQLTNANGWIGTSMDDIIEQRVLLFSHPVKLSKGDYTFYIQQVMRENPLQNILTAGIRIEKVIQ
jgi:gliding motility-associated lipoprotein GldH